jgi:hypothetical protein
MDTGSSRAVPLGAAQNLSRYGCHLADTEHQEAKEISGGIAFSPFEVEMRLSACYVSNVQQEGGEGVRDGRTFEGQHPVLLVHDHAVYVKL